MQYLRIKYLKLLYIKDSCTLTSLIISIILLFGCNPEGGLPSPDNYDIYIKGPKDQTPAVSPDGKLIAYYHFSNQSPEPVDYPTGLYVIDIDGKNRQKILTGNFNEPDWSPDGKWLVVNNNGTLIISSINGDSIRTYPGINSVPLDKPDWSSKNIILFSSSYVEGGGVFLTVPDFSITEMIFDSYSISGIEAAWSPDAIKIVFVKLSTKWQGGEIYTIDTVGTNEMRLTDNNEDDRNPVWAPDGNDIIWNTGNNYLKIMKHDGTSQRILTRGRFPSWCNNSENVVFCFPNSDFSKEVLWIININNKKQDQLTF